MRYLNTEEASKFLSCTQRNVQKLINKGTLQPINPYHKSGYLFEKEHIEAHADKRK
ncbi:MAG: helix-turn-helix domain-containing protein [Aequorivita sp.]|nr:helix-turn-helix domain-containing protein [Aequorivita sp.]